jgi:acyl-CoA synthetase (AMP-forming)/AMP-acid ligase II
VVFHNGKEVSEKDLSAYCRDELAPYKRPRRFVRLAALPRDASGRVPRDQLAAGTY